MGDFPTGDWDDDLKVTSLACLPLSKLLGWALRAESCLFLYVFTSQESASPCIQQLPGTSFVLSCVCTRVHICGHI